MSASLYFRIARVRSGNSPFLKFCAVVGQEGVFGSDDNIHLPHHCELQTVLYTGTHDNDTTRGWFDSAEQHERERALTYFGASPAEISWQMIRAAYGSIARLAIVPLQDLFSMGSNARMNTPGDSDGNWAWRAKREIFDDGAVQFGLRRLAEVTGRVPE